MSLPCWVAAAAGRICAGLPSVSGNLSVMMAPEQGGWSLQAYVKNITDGAGINGEFVSSDTAGLFTGAFYNDPRIFGMRYAVNL